jgi:hypothetical protein
MKILKIAGTGWAPVTSVMLILLGLTPVARASDCRCDLPRDWHVSTSDPSIGIVLDDGLQRSATLKSLVDSIQMTNGIVSVQPGVCRHAVKGCLLHAMSVVEGRRYLSILVDTNQTSVDLVGTIGHELQHAVEVLRDPRITSGLGMLSLVESGRSEHYYETDEAVRVGDMVRSEVRRSAEKIGRLR